MARRGSRWLRRSFLVGLFALVVGLRAQDSGFGLRLLAVGAVLVGAPLAVWWRRLSGSIGTVRRWSLRSRWNHGLASRWQILRHGSRWAVRRQMRTLRPSFEELSFWRRLWVPTSEFAYRLARVGWFTIWATCEDTRLVIGAPRTGKSQELAGRIIDAPGAVIATSTRTDLVSLTAQLRARRGPVFIFNPSGVGGLASTVTFDPLTGCDNPKTAVERAGDLIAGGPGTGSSGERGSESDREHWAGQARDTLAVLLHAAALGGRSMRDVHAWVSDPDTAHETVRDLLRGCPEPGFEAELTHFVATNDRTRSSITQSIRPALMWLHDPIAARAAGQPVTAPVIDASGVTLPDDDIPPGLDVEALLALSGTVYLLGAEEAQVAPLLAALTGHIARLARQIAARQPDGRLDPPLSLDLDEAALICPIPLDKWTADMGGRNITIRIAVQSRPQLRQRWGHDGAAALTNNATSLVIFGGTRDAADLQAYSTLAGEREQRVVTRDRTGKVISETTQRAPVVTPAQIAQLPRGRVLVIRRDMPPVIGRVEQARKRPDVRAVKRRNRRQARAEKRAVVWAHRRETVVRYWTEIKAAAGELVDGAAELARDWAEQRRLRADQRAAEQERQAEGERAAHERIDPQPAGPDHHRGEDDTDRDEPEAGESDD
jgi:type IV secretion system protein VirD4